MPALAYDLAAHKSTNHTRRPYPSRRGRRKNLPATAAPSQQPRANLRQLTAPPGAVCRVHAHQSAILIRCSLRPSSAPAASRVDAASAYRLYLLRLAGAPLGVAALPPVRPNCLHLTHMTAAAAMAHVAATAKHVATAATTLVAIAAATAHVAATPATAHVAATAAMAHRAAAAKAAYVATAATAAEAHVAAAAETAHVAAAAKTAYAAAATATAHMVAAAQIEASPPRELQVGHARHPPAAPADVTSELGASSAVTSTTAAGAALPAARVRGRARALRSLSRPSEVAMMTLDPILSRAHQPAAALPAAKPAHPAAILLHRSDPSVNQLLCRLPATAATQVG